VSVEVVVKMARRLRCEYGSDSCDKHDGTGGRKAEAGFTTCDSCLLRRAAQAARLPGERL
jgi:hypothetical protein